AAEEANISLIPLLDRDDVAIYNSIPTAEGTIMMAIENTDYTIHSSSIIVVGFGRVGNTVANKFSAFGAKVSVSANNITDLARITEMGVTAIPLRDLHEYTHECDLLINTVPAPVIKKDAIRQLTTHGLIIDLASKPDGTDFDFDEKRIIEAILARSVPSIVAPKTAGKILADVIKQILQEERGKEHDIRRKTKWIWNYSLPLHLQSSLPPVRKIDGSKSRCCPDRDIYRQHY